MLTLRMMLMLVHHVPDVVAGLFAVDEGGVFRLQTRKDTAPVFDDFGCLSVNFEPDERLAEDAAVCQRALHAWMCTEVAKTPLEHQCLAKPFDVAARQRQLAELQRRRLSWFSLP